MAATFTESVAVRMIAPPMSRITGLSKACTSFTGSAIALPKGIVAGGDRDAHHREEDGRQRQSDDLPGHPVLLRAREVRDVQRQRAPDGDKPGDRDREQRPELAGGQRARLLQQGSNSSGDVDRQHDQRHPRHYHYGPAQSSKNFTLSVPWKMMYACRHQKIANEIQAFNPIPSMEKSSEFQPGMTLPRIAPTAWLPR